MEWLHIVVNSEAMKHSESLLTTTEGSYITIERRGGDQLPPELFSTVFGSTKNFKGKVGNLAIY